MNESDRHVEVLYCDDIRQEVGGKISLMGIYAGKLIVPSIPIVLPKLCILIKVLTDVSDPFRRLSAHIERGEERTSLLSTGEIALPQAQIEDAAAKKSNAKRFTVVQLHFVLSPFQIEAPMLLRVRIETERGSINGSGLRIILPEDVDKANRSIDSDAGRLSLISDAPKRRKMASKTVVRKSRKKATH